MKKILVALAAAAALTGCGASGSHQASSSTWQTTLSSAVCPHIQAVASGESPAATATDLMTARQLVADSTIIPDDHLGDAQSFMSDTEKLAEAVQNGDTVGVQADAPTVASDAGYLGLQCGQ